MVTFQLESECVINFVSEKNCWSVDFGHLTRWGSLAEPGVRVWLRETKGGVIDKKPDYHLITVTIRYLLFCPKFYL